MYKINVVLRLGGWVRVGESEREGGIIIHPEDVIKWSL